MTTFSSILWAAVAALCAVGFGVVTGIFHPEEKVNGLWLVVAAACFYVLAYRFYGRFLARRVVELDNRRSEEHTSELQSPCNLVCRLLLEKKKINKYNTLSVTMKQPAGGSD